MNRSAMILPPCGINGARQVAAHVRLMASLGPGFLVLTNAAGTLNPAFAPGGWMMLDDHLNLTGANPLIGTHDLPHERFVDVSNLYPLAPVVAAAVQQLVPVQAAVAVDAPRHLGLVAAVAREGLSGLKVTRQRRRFYGPLRSAA